MAVSLHATVLFKGGKGSGTCIQLGFVLMDNNSVVVLLYLHSINFIADIGTLLHL